MLCLSHHGHKSYYYHIISYTIIYYHIISYTIIYYHILSYTIIYYHILSYTIIYYHILSYTIIYYHILSYAIIYYHILSHSIYIYIYHYISLGDAAAQYGNSANSWVSGPPFVSPRISSSGTLCSLTASQSMLNNAEWSQLSTW